MFEVSTTFKTMITDDFAPAVASFEIYGLYEFYVKFKELDE